MVSEAVCQHVDHVWVGHKWDWQHWNLTEEGLGLGTQCVRSGASLSRNLPLEQGFLSIGSRHVCL